MAFRVVLQDVAFGDPGTWRVPKAPARWLKGQVSLTPKQQRFHFHTVWLAIQHPPNLWCLKAVALGHQKHDGSWDASLQQMTQFGGELVCDSDEEFK